ncbi:hypothetical protein D3C73_1422430 [compost metagenome]
MTPSPMVLTMPAQAVPVCMIRNKGYASTTSETAAVIRSGFLPILSDSAPTNGTRIRPATEAAVESSAAVPASKPSTFS